MLGKRALRSTPLYVLYIYLACLPPLCGVDYISCYISKGPSVPKKIKRERENILRVLKCLKAPTCQTLSQQKTSTAFSNSCFFHSSFLKLLVERQLTTMGNRNYSFFPFESAIIKISILILQLQYFHYKYLTS